MSDATIPIHYVCTHQRARDLVEARKQFWLSNCGCREARGKCERSRMDVCLMFVPGEFASGTGKREVTFADAMAVLREAEDKRLVARPWRNEARTETDGICFCCDDCCGYFLNPEEKCDKGELVARTDFDACTHCGACVDVCYFKARALKDSEMTQDESLCYGCGLCATVCPLECIEMAKRP